jgi:hypothetical protein
MFGDRDWETLIDWADRWSMPNGWQIVIRADWTDVTVNRPHGVTYALILQDERGNRLLGFDNSHAYDGASDDAPYDHEHRANAVWRRAPYACVSGDKLLNDFFDRCEAYCASHGVAFEIFERDGTDGEENNRE